MSINKSESDFKDNKLDDNMFDLKVDQFMTTEILPS